MNKSKFLFIGLLVTFATFSGTMFGQVTSVGCTINPSKYSSAIGYQSTALGMYSFAAGYNAEANMDNSFVFGTGITLMQETTRSVTPTRQVNGFSLL